MQEEQRKSKFKHKKDKQKERAKIERETIRIRAMAEAEDVNKRMLIERGNAKREKWVSAINTTFEHIGAIWIMSFSYVICEIIGVLFALPTPPLPSLAEGQRGGEGSPAPAKLIFKLHGSYKWAFLDGPGTSNPSALHVTIVEVPNELDWESG
ncbi:hypothetical protein M8C21_023235, partial [Ambrosia artemisiifolia]